MFALLLLPLALAVLQPAPAASAEPAPSADQSAPAAVPTPAPAATPNPFPYEIIPPAPSGNSPRIFKIALNDRVQHLGKTLLVKVTVSPDVTGVTASSMGQTVSLPPAGPGAFGAMQELPNGFLASMYAGRDYNIDIIASTADGRSTKASIVMRLER